MICRYVILLLVVFQAISSANFLTHRRNSFRNALPVTSGIVVHYESRKQTGYADGDPVSTLTDYSGNGYNATGTTTTRPTWVANAGNGQPCLRFDGTDDYLSIGNPFSISNTVTIFVTYSRDSVSGGGRAQLLGHSNTTNGLQLEATDKKFRTIYPAVTPSESGDLPEAANTAVQTVMYRRSGSGAGTHTYRSNGLPLAVTTNGSESTAGNGVKEIGRRAAASQMLDGDLYAMLIYNRSLTDDEVLQVEDYLGSRYQSHLGNPFWLQYQGTASIASGAAAIQGVAYDGTNHWTMSGGTPTLLLKKWTRTAPDAYTEDASYDMVPYLPGDATQMNGLHYYGGYLWAGINNYVYPTQPPTEGWVAKINLSGVVVATYSTGSDLCEGGAWREINGASHYFAIYHDSFACREYDDTLTLVNTHTLPNPGVPDATQYLAQGGLWFGDYYFCPHHNGGASNKSAVHKWNGTGFTTPYYIGNPLSSAANVISVQAQGWHWDVTTTPVLGDQIICARRNGTGGEILRAKLRRRWGPTGL